MHSIINWIKSNKLTSILILFAVYTIFRQPIMTAFYGMRYGRYSSSYDSYGGMGLSSMENSKSSIMQDSMPYYPGDPIATPQPNIEDRMMVKNAEQALHVKDVRASLSAIETYTKDVGGYVVNKHINTPEESSSGAISVRVPTEKLESALKYFGEKAVKVVYESIYGTDITDQYEDTRAQLDILENTKRTYEGLLAQAVTFENVDKATNYLINTQQKIDNIKGRMQKMEGTANTALISVTLSTDELELGYAPKDAWRPTVIVKKAVRSLIANIRNLGEFAIWAGIYSVFWIPALIIVLVIKRKKQSKGIKGLNKETK